MAVAESNNVVLLSGGLDSSAAVAHALGAGRCRALFIDYGQPALAAELRAATDVASHFSVDLVTCRFDGAPKPSGEVLGRNAFLIFSALRFLTDGPCLLSIGIHAGTNYYDCSPTFISQIQVILDGYRDGQIRLNAPFKDWRKPDVFSYARQKGVPVHLTWSCEAAGQHPCGRCISCIDRNELLARA